MPELAPLLETDPESVGRYRLEGRLGAGGQGTVYLGEDENNRRTAIKVLHAHLITHEVARTRFLAEVDIAKRVAPFCTAQVLDSGVVSGQPYIVSEFVDGPSLQVSVKDGGGPRGEAALERLAINTVTALAGIHQGGVVHRDLKPDNVLLGPDGPVVIDFGISRALDLTISLTSSHAVGTPGYMAPEYIGGETAGPEADMFAWGATMAFAATGRMAFPGTSHAAVMLAVLQMEPDLGGLDGNLGEIVRACLEKTPANRPTATEVGDRLRALRSPQPPAPRGNTNPLQEAPAGPLDDRPLQEEAPARPLDDLPLQEEAPAAAQDDPPPQEAPATAQDDSPLHEAPAAPLDELPLHEEAPTAAQDDSPPQEPPATAQDDSPLQEAPAADQDELPRPRRKRRRVQMVVAATIILAIIAITASLATERGKGKGSASKPPPVPVTSAPLNSPTSTPHTAQSSPPPKHTKKASSKPHSQQPPSGTQDRSNPRPPATKKPPDTRPRNLGTLTGQDLADFCRAQGYRYSAPSIGDQVACSNSTDGSSGGELDDAATVCRWKYPNRQNVRADGMTCISDP